MLITTLLFTAVTIAIYVDYTRNFILGSVAWAKKNQDMWTRARFKELNRELYRVAIRLGTLLLTYWALYYWNIVGTLGKLGYILSVGILGLAVLALLLQLVDTFNIKRGLMKKDIHARGIINNYFRFGEKYKYGKS